MDSWIFIIYYWLEFNTISLILWFEMFQVLANGSSFSWSCIPIYFTPSSWGNFKDYGAIWVRSKKSAPDTAPSWALTAGGDCVFMCLCLGKKGKILEKGLNLLKTQRKYR